MKYSNDARSHSAEPVQALFRDRTRERSSALRIVSKISRPRRHDPDKIATAFVTEKSSDRVRKALEN